MITGRGMYCSILHASIWNREHTENGSDDSIHLVQSQTLEHCGWVQFVVLYMQHHTTNFGCSVVTASTQRTSTCTSCWKKWWTTVLLTSMEPVMEVYGFAQSRTRSQFYINSATHNQCCHPMLWSSCLRFPWLGREHLLLLHVGVAPAEGRHAPDLPSTILNRSYACAHENHHCCAPI